MNWLPFSVHGLIIYASNLPFIECRRSSDISTWAPELDFDQLTGSRCCDPGLEQNVNLNLRTSRKDDPECGRFAVNPGTGRIFQGRDAYAGQFPWFVLFYHLIDGITLRQYCGGVILDRFHVLTAAHCVFPRLGQDVTMAFGAYDTRKVDDIVALTKPVQMREWTTVFFPKRHFIQESNQIMKLKDMAIIKIPTPGIEWLGSNDINSICWRSADLYKFADCQNITAAGFGLVYGNKSSAPLHLIPLLQTRRLRICSQHHCDRHVSWRDRKAFRHEFCSARLEKPRSTLCSGDSGSPLITFVYSPSKIPEITDKRAFLVGIHSRSPGDCHETIDSQGDLLTGRHVKVQNFLDWITGVVDNDTRYIIEPKGWMSSLIGRARNILG